MENNLENMIPCEFCNRLILFENYQEHINQCNQNTLLSNLNLPILLGTNNNINNSNLNNSNILNLHNYFLNVLIICTYF